MGDHQYVEEELAKARTALKDAESLASADGSEEGIVNRLYYAAFHAAQAVLYSRGVEPTSHGAVRNLFGEEIVLAGAASRSQGRLLTTLADLRQQADYGYEPLDEDIDQLMSKTHEFVDSMAALIEGTSSSEES